MQRRRSDRALIRASQHPCWARARAALRGGVSVAVLCSLASVGCSISPLPEPPAAQPSVDLGSTKTKLAYNLNEPVGIEGGPGAASPAGATVRIFNLDAATSPRETLVADDGSFLVEIEMQPGDEARLQVLAPDARSKPVDFVVVGHDLAPEPSTHALGACLSLTPPLELDAATTSVVVATSACAEPVTLAAPYVRATATGFVVGDGGSWPATLATGDSVSIAVEFQASEGTLEEIFFVEATQPQGDRRSLTVFPDTG